MFSRNARPSSRAELQAVPIIEGFGTQGQDTANRLYTAIHLYNEDHKTNITLRWVAARRRFAFVESHTLTQDQIREVLDSGKYHSWYPHIIGTNFMGDFVVELKPYPTGSAASICDTASNVAWGVTDDARKFDSITHFIRGCTVLDVGCGKGHTTERMARELAPKTLLALEPGTEYGFQNAQNYLSKSNITVEKLTLQEAVENVKYRRMFDVVTIFKYNVPFLEKDAFAASLSQAIKEDGIAIITSVEKERCYYGLDTSLYLVSTLKKYFQSVEVLEVQHEKMYREGLILCRRPY